MPLNLETVGVRAVVQGANRYVADAGRVNAATATIGKTAKTTERRTVSMGESMRLGGTRMREMGTQAVFLGGALVALAAGPAFLAGRFESSFVKIQNLVGESKEALDELKPAVLALAGATARSPQELAEGLFVVESGGLRGAEALEVLDASARAAALGMGETADIARVTTQAILAFRSSNLTAARAVNVLVGTARAGNFETSQLASVFGKVLPLASQLGIRFSDLGAFVATYTRVGGDAAGATTALGAVLTALTRGGTAAIEALDGIGLSLTELRRIAREEGLAQALFAILEGVERGGEGAEERLAAIIPNIRALRGVLATAGVQAEDFIAIQNELRGELDLLGEGFDVLATDPMFRFQQAINDIKIGLVEFGATFLPIMADAVRVAAKAFEAFTSLPDPIQRLIGTTALLGGGLILIGGAFAIMAGSILSVTGSLIGMTGSLGGVTVGLTAARIAAIGFSTTPLFLGVAGITLGLLALAGAMALFSSGTDDAAEAQERLSDALADVTSKTEEEFDAIRLAARVLREELRVELADLNVEFTSKLGTATTAELRGIETDIKRVTKAIAAQSTIISDASLSSELRRIGEEQSSGAIRDTIEAIDDQIEALEKLNDADQQTIATSNDHVGALRILSDEIDVRADSIEKLIQRRDALNTSLTIAVARDDEETAALAANTAATDANAAAKKRLADAESIETAARRRAAEQIVRERGFAPGHDPILDMLAQLGEIDLADAIGPGVTEGGAKAILARIAEIDNLRQAALSGEIGTLKSLDAEYDALKIQLGLVEASAGGATAALTDLQQALLSLGERQERQQVEGLIRDLLGLDGPGLAEVRAVQSELDQTFARIAPILEERLGVIPGLFRDVLEDIVGEAENAALGAAQRGSDFGGILGVLLARRIADAPAGLGPGAGLIAAPGKGGLGVGEGSELGGGVNVETMNVTVGGGNNSPSETAEAMGEGLRATMAEQPA